MFPTSYREKRPLFDAAFGSTGGGAAAGTGAGGAAASFGSLAAFSGLAFLSPFSFLSPFLSAPFLAKKDEDG